MKALTVLYLLVFAITALCSQQADFPKLTGPYLGQKLPGMKPEVFAPGIVSAEDVAEHSPAAFSPDGKELFWSGSKQGFSIYHMRIENGFWTKPEIAPFTKGLDATNPVFSLDGKRLFFTSQIIENGEWHITLWHVDKVGNDWSDPIKVETITRFGDICYQVSFTKDGTIYFAAQREGGLGEEDIYRAKYVNGEFAAPEHLGNIINSKLSEQSVYIAPDESYIIFRRHVIGENDVLMDFYISFNHGGKWTEPVLFTDKLEAKGNGFWIGLSPDQKYIFFAKKGIPCRQYALGTSDIFWVSAKIIEGLRPKE